MQQWLRSIKGFVQGYSEQGRTIVVKAKGFKRPPPPLLILRSGVPIFLAVPRTPANHNARQHIHGLSTSVPERKRRTLSERTTAIPVRFLFYTYLLDMALLLLERGCCCYYCFCCHPGVRDILSCACGGCAAPTHEPG